MTRQDFGRWLNRLKNAFPAVDRFFDRPTETDARKLAALWFDVLHTIELEDADRAILALASGDLEPPTYIDDWSKLPGRVRHWCRDNRVLSTMFAAARFANDSSYHCLACRDRGYGVEVFTPGWVRQFSVDIERRELRDGWQQEARRWCSTAGCGPLVYGCDCCCDAGIALQRLRRIQRKVYHRETHCLVPPCGEKYWADALADFVAGHPVLEQNTWVPRIEYSAIVSGEVD